MIQVTSGPPPAGAAKTLILSGVLLSAALLFAYWPSLTAIIDKWASDPQHSHGFLVPAFSATLLWLRRDQIIHASLSPSWMGQLVLFPGLVLFLAGSYFHLEWFRAISFLPCLAGIMWIVAGFSAIRWSWPAIAFLFFMIPLPYSIATAATLPLQNIATIASAFFLQVLGQPALVEGNVILLNEVELGIVEACSGLRMMVVFFALATATAMLMKRPMWEKIVVIASAAPIAIIVNVLRITATGVLHETVGSEIANAVFHDLAGWLMMPIALMFLFFEVNVLSRLWIEEKDEEPVHQVDKTRVAALSIETPRRRNRALKISSPAKPWNIKG